MCDNELLSDCYFRNEILMHWALGSRVATRVLARVENDRDQRELYMNAFLIHAVARGFAQLIAIAGAPSLMRAAVWVALIVSASEAAAQPAPGGCQR